MLARADFASIRVLRRFCAVEIIERRFVFMLAVVGHFLVALQTDPHITAENQRRVDEDTANAQKHLQARYLGRVQNDAESGQKGRKKCSAKKKQTV